MIELLDPKNDVVFQKIFGMKKRKEILRHIKINNKSKMHCIFCIRAMR